MLFWSWKAILLLIRWFIQEKDAALIAGSSSLQSAGTSAKSAVELEQERILKVQNAQRLKEVEQQQEDFGEKNK